jgi:hypothetical protein
MIRGDRFSAGELNVVFEVWPSRGERVVEDCLVHWNKVNPLQDRLRIGAGSRFVCDSTPEEIEQWKSKRGFPALDFLYLRAKLSTRRLSVQPLRFVTTSMKTLTSMKIFNPSISAR